MFFGGRDNDNRNPLVAILVLILAPIAAMLIQLAISRGREYEADRGGAEVSGDPRALADALAKIERYARGVPLETAEMHPATAQMMIINPLSGGGISALFRTHPPTEERIAPARDGWLDAGPAAMEQAQRSARRRRSSVLAGAALPAALARATRSSRRRVL
jgi:heat shock protein HtpX